MKPNTKLTILNPNPGCFNYHFIIESGESIIRLKVSNVTEITPIKIVFNHAFTILNDNTLLSFVDFEVMRTLILYALKKEKKGNAIKMTTKVYEKIKQELKEDK